jgi:hypothetical protein
MLNSRHQAADMHAWLMMTTSKLTTLNTNTNKGSRLRECKLVLHVHGHSIAI